jgi:hypothetical protein
MPGRKERHMRSRLMIVAALVAGLIPAVALGSPSLTKRYKADLTARFPRGAIRGALEVSR